MDDNQFVNDIRDALKANSHARRFYFPSNRKRRKEMNLRLGREIGYGLGPDSDIGGLYSLLIVSFSFDSTGVAVDAKEFFGAVQEGIDKRTNSVCLDRKPK